MSNQDYMKPITMKSASDIVVDRLTQAIIDGQLTPGAKIPTEPELAASFQVGRNTVREAVRTLIAYGILEIRRPEGTFVCDSFRPHAINPMIYSIILKKEDSYQDLIGLRESIDFGTLHVLTEKGISLHDLRNLTDYAESIRTEIESKHPDAERICTADIAFHDAIAKATQNDLIITMNDMLSKLTYASRLETIRRCLESGQHQYLIDIHFELVDALRANNTPGVREALRNSYRYWAKIDSDSLLNREA